MLWIGFAAGAVLAAAVCWLLVRFRVLRPLKQLRSLVDRADELDAETLCQEAEKVDGVQGEVARAFAACLGCSDGTALRGIGSAGSEEPYKLRVVDEICRSLLPQAMKETPATLSYAMAGGLQRGRRCNCDFYDHFFLDATTLCMVVGRVPGSGIAEALFAVVAQTTIRARLRMGRSLVETMGDVNAQLYDLGGCNSVCALVSVLNTVNGRFSFVNAGGAMPLLMRSEGQYEWLRTPIYAALGANESVSYRSELLRLNQGDRLFLYTADLGEQTNREGRLFRERELQSALNRSRSKTRDAEELLRFVQDEAAAFCERGSDVIGSAAITLEYKKGSRDYVFTLIPGTPDHAPELTEFMRRTLTEGGVAPRDCARQILLADELFALCCRTSTAAADVKVECAILSEDNAFHLRMFAPLGGRDPLNAGEDELGGSAAGYIRGHTRRASFEAGIDRDMIEIVSDLS